MIKVITENTVIRDILMKHPESARIFMKYGMRCIG
ncbi:MULTISPECIES: DUF1858 domain-containing protein [Thermincola]|nr:DUF1858 domain-containing protein [Thermincola potens]